MSEADRKRFLGLMERCCQIARLLPAVEDIDPDDGAALAEAKVVLAELSKVQSENGQPNRASGDHLRMHRPVAAVPGVAHLVPSVAPLAHTSETRASSSAQRTVSVPVTTRRACAGPGSPFGPGGPAGPAGPAAPCGPSAPAGPAGPCGPGAGWPHPATASVMMRTEMLNSCRIGRPSGINGSLPQPSERSQETNSVVAAGRGHSDRRRCALSTGHSEFCVACAPRSRPFQRRRRCCVTGTERHDPQAAHARIGAPRTESDHA